METLVQFEWLGLVALAAVFGGIVGWEREQAEKSAGLRTHMLVSAASALLTLLGYAAMEKYLSMFPTAAIGNDPLRVLNAIVIGISFIGSGVILKDEKGGTVQNLTTAASILFAAGIGMATALGQYVFAGGASLILLAINRGMLAFESKDK